MSRIFSTLLLLAAFLWSSVCFAQCRILPPQGVSHALASVPVQKEAPPCHKQGHTQTQQPSGTRDCQEASPCFTNLPEQAAEPVVQLCSVALVVEPLTGAFPIVTLASPPAAAQGELSFDPSGARRPLVLRV